MPLELRQYFIGLALKKQCRALNVLGVVGLRDETDTGSRAALDLVEHARPRAIREHRVLARAQLKDPLQQRHAFAHRTCARKRTEVFMLAVERAAMKPKLWKWVARQAHVWIALVVAKENVVARLECFDQVIFEQQRLAFRAHCRRFDARDLPDHRGDSRLVLGFLEIVGDSLLEIARLPDIKCAAIRVEHSVHAG